MSMIKRWIDNEVNKIAKEHNLLWDEVMDFTAELDFDIEQVKKSLEDKQKK